MFKKDILIIDDSLTFCESICDLLEFEEPEWTIEKVHSGGEGIEELKNNEYKVILLDLKMPGMSGLEVLEKLNSHELVKRNYIIILTGEITIENAVNTLKYGARDFIQKNTVVDYTDSFLMSIRKGFEWQKERLHNEELVREKEKAIEESRLLVKSVGHDMSGSYYASLMLKLQMLKKKMEGIKNIYLNQILPEAENSDFSDDLIENFETMQKSILDAQNRSESVILLLKFFKELGENLKQLGDAIGIPHRPMKPVDLTSLVNTALHTYSESRILENPLIKIVEDYSNKPVEMLASEEDLLRVVINLIENAYKSMSGEGEIKLKTWCDQKNVYASIEDTGCGIPEENLENIWRPDFTSWKDAQGTGLGLVICKKAVENSQGEIYVKSNVDKGTCFTLKFTRLKK